MAREWSTTVRDEWCPKIAHIIKTIDLHSESYLATGDTFHKDQAEYLRRYIYSLKDWIQSKEEM
jgi:hypothetical protein